MGFQFATAFTALVVGPFGASKVLSIPYVPPWIYTVLDRHWIRIDEKKRLL